jgi:hypothetical protein
MYHFWRLQKYFESSNDRWDTPQIENTRRRIRKDYVEYKLTHSPKDL